MTTQNFDAAYQSDLRAAILSQGASYPIEGEILDRLQNPNRTGAIPLSEIAEAIGLDLLGEHGAAETLKSRLVAMGHRDLALPCEQSRWL